ncbi:hypothetical protein ACFLZ7_01700 [Nanoarchaeota archaeon]
MPERKIVVDELHLDYEGIFDATQLLNVIEDFFRTRGFDKRELSNVESVRPSGKHIELVLMPWKTVTDYARYEIKVKIDMDNLKEVDVKKDGAKLKLNQGKIKFVFDSYLLTDIEGRWEAKPIFFFIRTFVDKFFFRFYTSKWEEQLIQYTKELHGEVKSFLNLNRY